MTIKRVAIEKKQEFILYDKDDRKLITIDALSENYDKVQTTLKDHGKIHQKGTYMEKYDYISELAENTIF